MIFIPSFIKICKINSKVVTEEGRHTERSYRYDDTVNLPLLIKYRKLKKKRHIKPYITAVIHSHNSKG